MMIWHNIYSEMKNTEFGTKPGELRLDSYQCNLDKISVFTNSNVQTREAQVY